MAENTVIPNIPKITWSGMTEEEVREISAILYALALIRQETGHGTLYIEIKEAKISEMQASHTIRPKYLKT